jgi:hypothetical protein
MRATPELYIEPTKIIFQQKRNTSQGCFTFTLIRKKLLKKSGKNFNKEKAVERSKERE